MKRWLGAGLVLLLTLMSSITLSGCGGASDPEQAVRKYFDALSRGDSAEMASVFTPEVRERMSQVILPEISIKGLNTQKVSETEDTAEVTAEYDVDFPVQAHPKVKFTLTKIDGEWLISNAEAVRSSLR